MGDPAPHPDALQGRLVRELQRAVVDRHHAWRTPVLASVDAQGQAAARTVVLRAVEQEATRLQVYTDGRSPKARELSERPQATLVFWSARLHLQLRVQACARVHHAGPLVQAAWARMAQAPSAGDYLGELAPGEPLTGPMGRLQAPQLAVIELQALHWDALVLDRAGHQRMAWRFDDSGRALPGRPLVP